MSKYTTQLRWPIEQKLKDLGKSFSEDNWPALYNMLGLDDYPIFDESYRQTLNDKIIRAYYFREIGFETMGMFRWQMHRFMHEIMPYYNQMYLSEKLVTDPMLSRNMDYTEKWTRDETITNADKGTEARDTKTTGTSDTTDNTDTTSTTGTTASGKANETTSSTVDSRNVFQDTPMNGLDTGAIQNMDYATNVTFDHSTESGTSATTTENKSDSNTVTGTDKTTANKTTGTEGIEGKTTSDRKQVGDYDGTKVHNEKGFDGSQAELLLAYRKTFVNIDLEIVERCNVLFMGLW